MIYKIYQSIKRLNQAFRLEYLAVIVLAFMIFSQFQGTYTLPEPDSFYHAKIAKFLSEGKILHQLPWLQETYLAQSFVDHHFLYHLLLTPFVWLEDPLVGVKMATIVFSSLTILFIYWFLKKFNVQWPFLYVVTLFFARDWLFRASLVKAPLLFIIFALLYYYFLSRRKWLRLFVISFFAVWLYGGWPILLAMAIFYFLAQAILLGANAVGNTRQKIKAFFVLKISQLPWLGIVYTFFGLLAGLAVNPYFPANLNFYWVQIVKIALVNYHAIIRVGTEWYPYSPYGLFTNNTLTCALFVTGLAVLFLQFKKQSVHAITWGLITIAFCALTLKSRRNIDDFTPFALIFFALAFSSYLRIKAFSFLEFWQSIRQKSQAFLQILLLLFVVFYIFKVPVDLMTVKKDMLVGQPIDTYLESAKWLKENTPKNSVVFHTDWDDFPMLFYYNDHNYYITGLDHTFMYEKDKAKLQLYEDIISGKQVENLAAIIKTSFNAEFIFVEKINYKFDENLRASDSFKKVYEDDQVKIFQIVTLDEQNNKK